MKKRNKLLRQLHIGMIKVDLWNRVVDVAIKLADYAHTQAKKNFNKNRELANEMMGEDYSDDYKTMFKEISEIEL